MSRIDLPARALTGPDDLIREGLAAPGDRDMLGAVADAFRIRVSRNGEGVRVDVVDTSPALPVRQELRPDAAGGRGIGIVEHLASRWGVAPTADGKSVWFELSASGRNL